MLGELLERNAARRSPRFQLFLKAKTLYLSYLGRYPRSILQLTDDDYSRAASSSALLEAAECFEKASALAHSESSYRDEATALYQLGMIRHLQGRFAEATAALTSSLQLLHALPQITFEDVGAASGCHYHLGILLGRELRFDEALVRLTSSFELDQHIGDLHGMLLTQEAIRFYRRDAE